MTESPTLAVRDHGQSLWYDYIRADLMDSGELDRLIRDDGLAGLTSNPAIFDQAIAGTALYDDRIRRIAQENPGGTAEDLFFGLAIEDLQAAADRFRDVYCDSQGRDGFVSLEVSPALAHDTAGTIEQAQALFARIGRPNAMIKVPATDAGIEAIHALIASGVSVNATLIFSVERYAQVLEAYLSGLEERQASGLPLDRIASVASLFVSRVDTAVDGLLEGQVQAGRAEASTLLGRVAIANAKAAYAHYREVREDSRHLRLAAAGAQPQRLLWASTGAKNPAYSDVLYVESLIGPDTVNTLPPATLKAFRDHGHAAATLAEGLGDARAVLGALEALGIDLGAVTARLEHDGLKTFADAFDHLLGDIDVKRARLVS